MDIESIERIIQVFEKAKVSKLDLEVDNIKIKLEKPEVTTVITNIAEEKVEKKVNVETTQEEGTWVKSPLVGTYYAQRSQGAEPFITVGKKVKKGEVICIIEAMKVMSEITADRDGVVLKINPVNEQMVQFDENLVLIGDEQ